MKYLLASDIHGNEESAKAVIKKFKENQCDKIILLGDYLGFDKNENDKVIDIFNFFKDDIIALIGNCDRYFESPFDFELRESFSFKQNERIYCMSHGDKLEEYIDMCINIDNVYLVFGHTHRVSNYTSGNINFVNIGSISFPRGGSKRCYGIVDENGVRIFDLNDKLILSIWYLQNDIF